MRACTPASSARVETPVLGQVAAAAQHDVRGPGQPRLEHLHHQIEEAAAARGQQHLGYVEQAAGIQRLRDAGEEGQEGPHVALPVTGPPVLGQALESLDARQHQVGTGSADRLGHLDRRAQVADAAPAAGKAALDQHVEPPPRAGRRDPRGQQPDARHRVGQAIELKAGVAAQLVADEADIRGADQLVGVEDARYAVRPGHPDLGAGREGQPPGSGGQLPPEQGGAHRRLGVRAEQDTRVLAEPLEAGQVAFQRRRAQHAHRQRDLLPQHVTAEPAGDGRRLLLRGLHPVWLHERERYS